MKADKFKARVMVNRMVMEEFDDDGNPIIVTKKDQFGQNYLETVEVQYRKGDIITLPMEIIERKGRSLQLVLEPVKIGPVKETKSPVEKTTQDTQDTPAIETSEGKETTVADMIPKETPEKSGDETKGNEIPKPKTGPKRNA